MDVWGFGRGASPGRTPPAETIAALLRDVGFDKIEIRVSGALVKRHAAVSLDLSSVGQGYGVDQLVELVRAAGLTTSLAPMTKATSAVPHSAWISSRSKIFS